MPRKEFREFHYLRIILLKDYYSDYKKKLSLKL